MSAPYYVMTSGACTILPALLVEDVARLLGQDADHVARVLLAARGWYARQEADELAHARHRDDPMRLASLLVSERVSAWRRGEEHPASEDVL